MKRMKYLGLMLAVLASGALFVPYGHAAERQNISLTNVDLGRSGWAGTLDIFPSAIAKGKTTFTATANTGNTVTTVTNAAQAAARTYTIPDAGASASFVMTAGAQTVGGAKTLSSTLLTSSGVGAKNGATVSAVERGDGVLHQTVLTCAATPITITDEAGSCQWGGTAKLYDFPDGALVAIGAVATGDLTLGTTGTIINTYAGIMSLGTAAATSANATLTTTEADIIASTATTEAVAKVAATDAYSTATLLTESGAAWLDGTGTAKDLYLNFIITDDVSHTSGTGTWTGTITLTWINLGDYS